MKTRLMILGILVIISAQAFAQGDAKAVEIVKKARAVVGKEDKIKALQNVVAEGTFKQSMGQRNMEGPLEVTMAMPDKIYRSITRSFGPMEMVQIDVLNGATTWNDMQSSQPMPGGGGGNMMRGMMGFLDPAIQERNRRNDLARVMLGWFLLAPTGLNAEYTYVGEAKAPDGTADVIGVKTADGLVAKLYIDQQSKQLLMLSYKDKDMSAMFRGGPGGQGGQRAPGAQGGGQPGSQPGGQPGGQGGQGGQRGPGGMSREEFDKLPQAEKDKLQAEQRARQEQQMAERKAAYEKAPEVDYQWSFSDYKEVNGLNLPHVLTKAVGGNPNEEWVISKFKFNEKKVTADKFEKKGK
jgi:hypothetical protein